MKKLDQRGLGHLVAILLLLVVLAGVGFAAWRVMKVEEDGDDVEIAEVTEFSREDGTVFPDVRLHNMEAVTLPDGRLRAYIHEGPSGTKSAISTDSGRTFAMETGERVRGGTPATVRLKDGTWRTYYGGRDGLVSAVSRDGFTYTDEPGVRIPKGGPGELDEFGVTHPSIVALPDGSYRLYYDGQFKPDQGPHWRIMSASSKDGLTWTKDPGSRIPVDADFGDFHAELAFSCHVMYKDGRYTMYFSAQGNPISAGGIWRATSTDGLNFSVEDRPILARDPEFGNQSDEQTTGGPKGVPQDPFIINTSLGERLYYWTSDKGYRSALRR